MDNAAKKHFRQTVMLSGCGGGCDVMGCMVMGSALKSYECEIIYTSLSFTNSYILDDSGDATDISGGLRLAYEVKPGVVVKKNCYFPEALVANYIQQAVYIIPKHITVEQIRQAYRFVFQHVGQVPDALYLVDGGADVLMRGTETGLATPVEDMMNLAAVRGLEEVPTKFIQALGTTVDCGHGIVEGELTARLEDLRKDETMLWSDVMKEAMPAVKYFIDGVNKCNPVNTIVQSLTIAAIQGHRDFFTPEHLVPRIGRSTVRLSEQTATLFCFDLESVAAQVEYLDRIEDTFTTHNMVTMLDRYRRSIGKR